eukprot:s675_g32.t1
MLAHSKFFIALLLVFILEGCDHDRSDSPSSKARNASEVVEVPGWEAKGFPLSFAIKAGSIVYVSGMQGMDMKQMKLVEGGVKEETKQILRNLDTVLQAANSSMKQVTLCSVSLVNISDFKDMNEAYASFWSKDPPARVAVQVAALAGNASVEIQCNAALNTKNRSIVEVPSLPDPSAKGFPLSWATKVDGMVYMSGTQGMDMATGKLVPGGVKAETTQALENIKQLLQAAKSNAGRVVACSVSLIDIKDFAEMNEAYQAFWPHAELGGLPSRVCVEVSALAGQGKESPFQVVGDLFACWGQWSEPNETDLQLHDFELQHYMNPAFGTDKQVLDFNDVAMTVLHSYGNALTSCPCGCRAAAFSPTSLRNKGLRGFFVQSAVHHNASVLHPHELGLLLGMPASVQCGGPPRSDLALLGLIASPSALDLCAFANAVLRDGEDQPLVIHSPAAATATVAQLLQAQRISFEWKQLGGISLAGHLLSLGGFLDSLSGPYQLDCQMAPPNRPRLPQHLVIGIRHQGTFLALMMQAGPFLFEGLRRHDIFDVLFLVDAAGKIYGADYRAWRPLNLTTLAPGTWPPTFPFQASGPADSALGLHDGHTAWTLQQFLLNLPMDFRPLWTHCVGWMARHAFEWVYSDSILGLAAVTAGQLAATLSLELSLHCTLSSRHLIAQQDDGTCGSIALLMPGFHLDFLDFPLDLPFWIFTPGFSHDLCLDFVVLALDLWAWSFCGGSAGSTGCPSCHQGRSIRGSLRQSSGSLEETDRQCSAASFGRLTLMPSRPPNISSQKKKDKRQPRQSAPIPLELDPSTLKLDVTHFVDDDGDSVPQITLDRVVADGRGVAIATLADSMPYMQETKNISHDAFAILIIQEVPDSCKGTATISSLRFPVTYLPTSDPLLINGSILQLGDHEVLRAQLTDPTSSMDVAETHALKAQLFRDEMAQQCMGFIEDSLDQVIHEVWGCRFQSIEGKVQPASNADLFMAFLRIATPALNELLRTTVEGVYLEPRASSARAIDDDYAVPGSMRLRSSLAWRLLWPIFFFAQSSCSAALQLFHFPDLPTQRWGEAQHPGPPGLHSFGFSNSSGLRQKEHTVMSLGEGVWSFAETQLSATTQFSCARILRTMANQQNRQLRLHFGAPAVPRSTSTWAGTWSGVATISDYASQEIMLPYAGERECGRVLVSRHAIGRNSVTTAVVYGYAGVLHGHQHLSWLVPSWPFSPQ